MITQALTFISARINSEFFLIGGSPKVVVGNITALNDAGVTKSDILLSLINIEEEASFRNAEYFIKQDLTEIQEKPPVHLNLTIIFGAYMPNQNGSETNYEDSISKIQKVIRFFQHHSIIDGNNTPGMPAGIEKLSFDLVNLNFEQLHHLWSMLGGKYIPSVVYKMRLVTTDKAVASP